MGPSKGADMELELAKKLKFKIFYKLDEIPIYKKGQEELFK
jgi:hypothetical protein